MISNSDFEKDIKNLDYLKIMNSVIRRYKYRFDNEEKNQLRHIILFEALSTYDPKYNTKFTTHLYHKAVSILHKTVYYENRQTREIKFYPEIRDNNNTYYYDNIDIVDIMCDLNKKDRELLEYRYFHNMSFYDIGQIYGVTGEAIRVKINNILEYINDS